MSQSRPATGPGRAAVAVLVVGHEIDEVGRLADRGDVICGRVRVRPGEVMRNDVDDELGVVGVQRRRKLLDEGRERVLVGGEHALEIDVDALVAVELHRGQHLVDEHVDRLRVGEQLIGRLRVDRVVGQRRPDRDACGCGAVDRGLIRRPEHVPSACACQPVGLISVTAAEVEREATLFDRAVLMTKASTLTPVTLGAAGTVTLRIGVARDAAERERDPRVEVAPRRRSGMVAGSEIDAGVFPCQLIRACSPSIQVIVAPGSAARTAV